MATTWNQAEDYIQRMARRMDERKRAKLAAAARAPKPRVLSAEQQAAAHLDAHNRAVESELRAIVERIDLLDRFLRGSPPGEATFGGKLIAGGRVYGANGGGANYRDQELVAERRMLATLYREIEAERGSPITADRDGRPLTERDFVIARMRAVELAQSYRDAAERAAAAGDYREARSASVNAHRSRHVAEHELRWRPFLAGFSQPWS